VTTPAKTRLRVAVLASTASAYQRLKPRLDARADELVRGIVPAEAVGDAHLREERHGRVEHWRALHEGNGHDLRRRVRQVRREVVCVCWRRVVCNLM
jgi:hypothetical protein